METKKSKKSDLEKIKSIFFQFGLIISLAIVITAFEWTTYYNNSDDLGIPIFSADNAELPPITLMKQEIKPPAPKIVLEIINIVNDDVVVNDTIQFQNTENFEYKPNDSLIVTFEPEVETDDLKDLWDVDLKPQFPGGEEAMYKFVADNTPFNRIAKENGIQGSVFVEFTINKKGEVINPKILRGVDSYLDKAVLNTVMKMPNWSIGIKAGKPVSVRFVLPVKFKLS